MVGLALITGHLETGFIPLRRGAPQQNAAVLQGGRSHLFKDDAAGIRQQVVLHGISRRSGVGADIQDIEDAAQPEGEKEGGN